MMIRRKRSCQQPPRRKMVLSNLLLNIQLLQVLLLLFLNNKNKYTTTIEAFQISSSSFSKTIIIKSPKPLSFGLRVRNCRQSFLFSIKNDNDNNNNNIDSNNKKTTTTTATTTTTELSQQQQPLKMESSSTTEYRNGVTQFLSNFMQKPTKQNDSNTIAETTTTSTTTSFDPKSIDFHVPKFSYPMNNDMNQNVQLLASLLDYELYKKEWFVTGNVNPIYFANNFQFYDPDVRINSIEEYAYGVHRLFNQRTCRAEIVQTIPGSTSSNDENNNNTIVCTWRLSGHVNIGPFGDGLAIKPYIIDTIFTIDSSTGLIILQEDQFRIPQWDILLSAFFPFLIGIITSPPAEPVLTRMVPCPSEIVVLQQGGPVVESKPSSTSFFFCS